MTTKERNQLVDNLSYEVAVKLGIAAEVIVNFIVGGIEKTIQDQMVGFADEEEENS